MNRIERGEIVKLIVAENRIRYASDVTESAIQNKYIIRRPTGS